MMDNGLEGNYWDDYTGADDGSNNRFPNDGIGDTKIPHHYDEFPLMNPWHWKLPQTPTIKTICHVEGYNSTGEYNVTWHGVSNTTQYVLQESATDDFAIVTNQVETSDTKAYFTSKVNDTYFYRVRAENEWGHGMWSDFAYIVVDHLPFTPTGLKVEPHPVGNSLSLDWQTVEGDVASYQLYYTTDGDAEWHMQADLDHPANDTLHHGLVDGQNYTYRVRSVDERGQPSPWSEEVTERPGDTVAPAMPSGLQLGSVEDDSVTLLWQPNMEADLAGYNIYRLDMGTGDGGTRDIGGGYELLNPPPPDAPHGAPFYEDKMVESGHEYSYTITAVDEVPNESLPAYDVEATVPQGNLAPEVANIQYDVEMPEDSVDETSIDLLHWFRDPDGQVLFFTVKGAKHFEVTIFQSSGEVTLEPHADWNGVDNLTFTASDGELSVNDTIAVTVTFVNDPPEKAFILKPADGSMFDEGDTVNFTGTAEDIDFQYGDELTYSWRSNISGPLGLGSSISVSTLDPGVHTITLTATDKAGKSVNTSMTLKVEPAQIVEPPDGTEDGGDGNISDGGDPTHEDDDKGFLGDSQNVAVVAVVVVVMAVMAVGVLLALRKKRQELERLKKEEEEMGPALEGEVAALPGKPLKTGPVPIPKPMLKPMPVLPEGPKAEELDGEWELAQEEGPSPVLRSESIMKDPFSKKRREVVEADYEEEADDAGEF